LKVVAAKIERGLALLKEFHWQWLHQQTNLAIYCSCSNLLAMYESSGAQKSQISDET
jgi:hypothetical protein